EDANQLAHRATVAGLSALIFTPLLLIAIALWLARSVAAPLRRTVGAASSVAAGDFDVRLDERRHDEFGELGRRFNAMTESRATSASTSERSCSRKPSLRSHTTIRTSSRRSCPTRRCTSRPTDRVSPR